MVNTIYFEIPKRNLKVIYSPMHSSVSGIYQILYISTSEYTQINLHHPQTYCRCLSVCIHAFISHLNDSIAFYEFTYLILALRTLTRTLMACGIKPWWSSSKPTDYKWKLIPISYLLSPFYTIPPQNPHIRISVLTHMLFFLPRILFTF